MTPTTADRIASLPDKGHQLRCALKWCTHVTGIPYSKSEVVTERYDGATFKFSDGSKFTFKL